MITFKKVRFKNFLSSGNTFQEVDLVGAKTTLLFGRNGSGKSMITDAITYALYGKPFRKINKPQLINNYNKNNLVCELEFSCGKNDFKIIRGQKPNIFEIYKNGKLIDQDSNVYDYQEYFIENYLKMNYKSFTQIVIVGSATYIPFMQLSPQDRRLIVEDLLNIDIISKMNVTLKRRIFDNNNELSSIRKDIEIYKEKIKVHDEYIKTNIQTLDETLVESKKKIDDVNQKIIQKENVLFSLKNGCEKLEKEIQKYVKFEGQYRDLEKKENELLSKIKYLEKSYLGVVDRSTCPKCNQVITDDHKHNLKLTYDNEKNKITQYLEKIEALKQSLSNKLEKLNTLNEKLEEAKTQQYNTVLEIKNLKQYKEKLENDYVKTENAKKAILSAINENVQEDKEHLNVLEQRSEKILNLANIYSKIQTILKDDGIKTKIIKHYLPKMNYLINKYLDLMNFGINFQLNENFEEIIKNPAKEGLSYENFSQGERLRIDLAILFAWREIAKIKSNVTTNLLIMDEILDSSLDNYGIDDFLHIITRIVDNSSNIFIISHKDEQIVDKFSRALFFEKPDGRYTKITQLV